MCFLISSPILTPKPRKSELPTLLQISISATGDWAPVFESVIGCTDTVPGGGGGRGGGGAGLGGGEGAGFGGDGGVCPPPAMPGAVSVAKKRRATPRASSVSRTHRLTWGTSLVPGTHSQRLGADRYDPRGQQTPGAAV